MATFWNQCPVQLSLSLFGRQLATRPLGLNIKDKPYFRHHSIDLIPITSQNIQKLKINEKIFIFFIIQISFIKELLQSFI